MKKYYLGFLCLLQLLLGTPPTSAMRMHNLYQVSVPVTSQQPEVRAVALQQALQIVLIRASGNAAIASVPAIKQRLSNADNLVEEYSYITNPAPAPANQPWRLQVSFDATAVQNMLRNANVAIWGQDRPLIIIWLWDSLSGQPAHMVADDTDHQLVSLLKQATDTRGVPVALPLMDLTDMHNIAGANIPTGQLAPFMAASQRYGSNSVLTGALSQSANGFQLAATLTTSAGQTAWQITGTTLAEVLHSLANRIADTLAGKYATVITSHQQASIQLTISGIQHADDVSILTYYLDHLTPVLATQIMAVNGSRVVIQVQLRSTPEAFIQALAVDQRLVPVTSDTTDYQFLWKE